MNRLQKKCAIATVGVHLLLLVILIVGPAFFAPRQKADDLSVLDVIPANLIDAAFNSGVRNAEPPPPVVQPAPQPPPPQPVVTPPAPQKMDSPAPAKPPDKLSPDNLKPVEKPVKTEPGKIQINTQLVTRTVSKNPTANPPDDSRRQQRLQQQALQNVVRSLKNNLTSAMEIDLPGNSTVAYANYGAIVVSVYHKAWAPPNDMASDNAVVRFTVTIASDGTVISARILTPSGDVSVDAAVQRMLDRVTYIAPFPKAATEKERTYPINFNATRTTTE